jgi:hypothetical protein
VSSFALVLDSQRVSSASRLFSAELRNEITKDNEAFEKEKKDCA